MAPDFCIQEGFQEEVSEWAPVWDRDGEGEWGAKAGVTVPVLRHPVVGQRVGREERCPFGVCRGEAGGAGLGRGPTGTDSESPLRAGQWLCPGLGDAEASWQGGDSPSTLCPQRLPHPLRFGRKPRLTPGQTPA